MATADHDLAAALAAAEQRYIEAHPKSNQRHLEAAKVMPGGNTRTVLHFSPFPFAVVKGEGSKIHDIDGNIYTDFLGEFSAGLFGHSHPKIVTAATEGLKDGFSFGAPNMFEAEFAKLICDRFPSIDLVRFCNSGTEANMMAILTAKAATGRSKIMVFNGGYHGAVFKFADGGSPTNAPFDFVVAAYNDMEKTGALIDAHAKDLAVIIIEPVIGGGGCLPADKAFLQMLRDKTRANGTVLIFDEVMTSRLSPGGIQQALGVTPDMTTLGKYLGGGFSFGAFGGSRELMGLYDPSRKDGFGHAGTFNNNTFSMRVGLTGLRDIYTPEAANELSHTGDWFRSELNRIASDRQVAMQVTGFGSMMSFHFQRGPIGSPEAVVNANEKRALCHLEMLESGFSFARRGYMALSLALSKDDYDGFLGAFDKFTTDHTRLLQ